MGEVRERQAEGYSVKQLMRSMVPAIGNEVKVKKSEVTAVLEKHEVVFVEGRSSK